MISGGHAIMLDVEMIPQLDAIAAPWILEKPVRKRPKLAGHATLVFVGRDLDDRVGQVMIRACVSAVRLAPQSVRLLGELAMFGAKQDTLVALLEKGELQMLRDYVVRLLREEGVGLRPDYAFNPHVTIAVGTPGDKRPQTGCPRTSLRVTGLTCKIGEYLHPVGLP